MEDVEDISTLKIGPNLYTTNSDSMSKISGSDRYVTENSCLYDLEKLLKKNYNYVYRLFTLILQKNNSTYDEIHKLLIILSLEDINIDEQVYRLENCYTTLSGIKVSIEYLDRFHIDFSVNNYFDLYNLYYTKIFGEITHLVPNQNQQINIKRFVNDYVYKELLKKWEVARSDRNYMRNLNRMFKKIKKQKTVVRKKQKTTKYSVQNTYKKNPFNNSDMLDAIGQIGDGDDDDDDGGGDYDGDDDDGGGGDDKSGDKFTLLSWNILSIFDKYQQKTTLTDKYVAIQNLITNHSPDIIALQECDEDFAKQIHLFRDYTWHTLPCFKNWYIIIGTKGYSEIHSTITFDEYKSSGKGLISVNWKNHIVSCIHLPFFRMGAVNCFQKVLTSLEDNILIAGDFNLSQRSLIPKEKHWWDSLDKLLDETSSNHLKYDINPESTVKTTNNEFKKFDHLLYNQRYSSTSIRCWNATDVFSKGHPSDHVPILYEIVSKK